MTSLKEKQAVHYITIDGDNAGQRIDNYLFHYFKSVPKTHIYKIIRKGEVRVNKGRVDASYKLLTGDSIRMPPISVKKAEATAGPSLHTAKKLKDRILYEDDHFLIMNKPSGMSVHAGSTVRLGIIESMKHLYPKLPQLELAHRLDSDTSGCLILTKKRSTLREVHQLLREGKVRKIYLTLTKGHWQPKELKVDLPLHKTYLEGGAHLVKVTKDGKKSTTIFKTVEKFNDASLMQVKLETGRTHQIRVHAYAMKHPIACDDRYGDPEFNKCAKKFGLKRLFLHAQTIDFTLPSTGQHIKVVAPLDDDLENTLTNWRKHE